jgi:hypothetical protein
MERKAEEESDSGAIGDDDNAAGRPPADAQQAEDRQDMP